MSSSSETQLGEISPIEPITLNNSPITYGLGSFGLESAYKVFIGFYIFYYVDVLGLAVALAAVINIVFAIWDAVNDPLVGYLSDNTRTRWGRRRPWLLAGLPFYVILLVLTYTVPEVFRSGQSLFWYALVSVNYDALFPELFQGFRERTRASSYYQGFSMVGELVGFALTPIIYAQYGFGPMAVFFAAITAITLLIGILRSSEDPRAQKVAPLNLKDAFGEVLQDRPFWLFAIALTFLTFTTGLYTLATPFWVKYTLNASPQATSLIFATVFIVAILTVSLWSRLIRYRGVKRAWFWAIGALALSAIVLGLAPSLIVGAIGAAVAGVGLAGIKICREMIMANLVNKSLARTGYRQEGIYYSVLRFFGKLSKILEALALILLAVLFGYISGDDPGPNPDNAFRFLISVLPFVFMVIALLLSRRFPFEDQAVGEVEGQEAS